MEPAVHGALPIAPRRRSLARGARACVATVAVLAMLLPGRPAHEPAGLTGPVGWTPAHTGRSVQLLGGGGEPGDDGWDRDGSETPSVVAAAIRADEAWKDGITGAGVDVALVDSGVSPVPGLDAPDSIVNGPDLSFDLQAGAPAWLDAFGHGTHLAGIITAGGPEDVRRDGAGSTGIAPGARIVSVKVAGATGGADVSQVIAAIDWVVQHRADGDLNVRVLALAFGTDGTADYRTDPLARAVENAWEHGIVVVASAGNSGADGITNPAFDPFVIAVGADDTNGTADIKDDTVPGWSSRGDGTRNPDVVAPGVGVRSLRVPGSTLDTAVPATAADPGRIGGSGTSQAAAVVAGAVALLLEDRPDLTPDQVKALLVATATPLPGADDASAGSGLVNIDRALGEHVPADVQSWTRSTGTGSLEASRGSVHVAHDGIVLAGEQDVFGAAWDGGAWADASATGSTWQDGTWNGNAWAGLSWSGLSWSGLSWSGLSWSGLSWSGLSWSGLSWSGLSWSGLSWSAGR